MFPHSQGLMHRDIQGHWLRLRTLTRMRWAAAFGQLVALAVAYHGFDLRFNLTLCLLVVSASVASNLASVLIFPRSRRLSEAESLLTLMFDTAQLSLLLYLTGGLGNPFALLLLAPVIVAATTLGLQSVLLLGAATILLTTLLTLTFQPIALADGTLLLLPDLLRFGFWLAIVIGVVFIGLYSRSVAAEKHAMAEALLATQMALAREQKLTDLTGVVAAAAHELGTPLATIKLASAELSDALADDPELREDAELIREQAERCRAILRSMGQAGKDDTHLHLAPVEAILTEAAQPHAGRGKAVHFTCTPRQGADPRMPDIHRAPEIIHGLRNLIQNAVDFAATTVWIDADWDAQDIRIRVSDDGPGYPPGLLRRIGEPYLRDRRDSREDRRPGYEGMGLGLFIAKTLFERSGASVRFANAPCPDCRSPHGAVAEIRWPRDALAADARRALGDNLPNLPPGP